MWRWGLFTLGLFVVSLTVLALLPAPEKRVGQAVTVPTVESQLQAPTTTVTQPKPRSEPQALPPLASLPNAAPKPNDARFPASQAGKPAQAPRNVGGDVVPVPVQGALTGLERVPAIEPPPPVPKPVEPLRLARAIVESAGRLQSGSQTILLADVIETPPDLQCEGPGGLWPCGMQARTALRAFLRSRALVCSPIGATGTHRCLAGKDDLSRWLVEQGWAKAEPGADLAETERQAASARRGLHGSGR